ncbi:TPA: hypothetical protein ACXNP2_002588 [Stenotrophomonas maltophilia]
MKLKFNLLIIDDEENSAQAAIQILHDHLNENGFSLVFDTITDISEKAIRTWARRKGKEYDLVIIDFGLGDSIDGSDAAATFRSQLPYTDIVFFSSSPKLNLLKKLAEKDVPGVFVSSRQELGETLVGVANTIIGKAIDLNHMRGIAIAEVAEIDQSLEEILLLLYSASPLPFDKMDEDLLRAIREGSDRIRDRLDPLIDSGNILEIISDSSIFTSFQKYQAVRVLAKKIPDCKPHLDSLKPYQTDVIENRNILAHAIEMTDSEGNSTLKTLRRDKGEIVIDDDWMRDFRRKLSSHRGSLVSICDIIRAHTGISKQNDSIQLKGAGLVVE